MLTPVNMRDGEMSERDERRRERERDGERSERDERRRERERERESIESSNPVFRVWGKSVRV